MKNEDFSDLDKGISKKIMDEVKGKEIESICPYCEGEGIQWIHSGIFDIPCDNCNGKGVIIMEF